MKIRLNPHTLQRAFVLLLFSLVAGISSVFAQGYTYLQFSGNGRTVLLAKDGALTVVSTTEDAPAGDGYQWTLETVSGDNVRLKNKEGMYVTAELRLTNSQNQAATFTKTENTYSKGTYGGSRYDLVYGGKGALGVKNGQLFWTVEDSRYGCIRLANNVKGAKVTPLVSSEGGEVHWYYMELLGNGSECVKDAGAGNKLQKYPTPSAKNLRAYMWCVYEVNDKGDVYIKSADGNFFCQKDGTYQYSTSTQSNTCKYRICDVADQTDGKYQDAFVLYNTQTTKYVFPYGSGNPDVGMGSTLNQAEAMRFISTPPPAGHHIYQFSANAATAIYDNGTSVTMQPVGSEVAGYQWTLEQVGGAYVLKSGRDNYLKQAGNALTVTTNRDEALRLFPCGSAYDDRHYVLTLADDASKAVGVKDGQLAIVEANSFYSVVRILDSTDEVKGAVAPKISDISNVYYYKLQFKANPKGDACLTLTSTGYDNPVTRKEFEPTSASQNWKLEPARHANSKPGDFYLVNQMGEYLIYKDGRFNFETLDVNETTVFRLKQTDEQPEYWTIDMALSGDDNHRLGLQAGMTPYTLQACNSTSKFNALSFKESKRGSDYDYLQFSGSGRIVLYDDGQNVKAVATTTEQLEGNGYQWTFDPIMDGAGNVNGFNLKNKADRFLRYNAADETFTSVTDRSKASVFDADQNTYYVIPAHVQGGTCNIAGGLRYNAVLRGITGTYNTLGVKNGKLQLVKKNSRYAVVRLAENIEGGLVNPYVSTSANPHYYALNFFQNGSEYLQDNTPGNILLKSPVAPFPLRRYCWILEEANDDGDVYIRSTAGNYISYNPDTDGYQHKVNTTTNEYSRYKICDVADQPDASLDGLWSLYNCTNHYFVRPSENDKFIGRAEKVGKNTSMTFVDVAADTISYHFVFPAMGQRALIMDYDEAKKPRVKARDILASDKDARLYQWVVEGQHIRNRAGFYLTYDKKNKQFGVSNQKADAYTFVYNVNNYENNNSVRYDLCSTDDQQALSIGEEGVLCWAAPNTRNSAVDLRPYIIAPELPIPSLGGADYHLYCIRTDGGDRYAYHMEDATNSISLKPYEEKNLCQLWVLIRDGEGKGDGYLQSAYNRHFLKYDTGSNTFVAVADKNDATRIRLVETSGNYIHWQIELPDVNDSRNLISHSYSGGGNPKTVSLSLQGPNNGNNFVYIFPVDITPDFYEEAGGAFRNINLDELTPKLELTADGTALKAKASASEDDANNSWKNIGTKDDFVLRNGHGQYIGADAEGNVFLTTDKAQATHFYLWLNHGDEDGTVSWCFAQLNADGSKPEGKPEKCLGVSDVANGTVAMLPFSTYETDRLHTLCFNFGRLTCPELSDAAEGKYYYNFICFDKAGNKYISDGNGTSKVVFAENDKKLVNDQMWALVGQNKDDVVLMSKDKYYVYLNGNRFNVTHDPERAVHFSVKYISSKQRYALTIVGGLNAEGKIGQSMNLSGADANRNTIIPWNSDIQTDPNICLNFEPIPVPEDFSDYEVLPKRSWFVKQAHEATADPMTGFIQRDESGWTKNPYTGKMMQKTSTYTITHYLKAESTRKLYVPTCMVGSAATRSRAFQRWYNYKTDEAVSDSVLNLDLSSSRRYRNGIVVGEQLNLNGQNYGNYVDNYVTFQMPEVIPDDWEYILGGDLTTYSDFVDYFGDNGNPIYNGNVTKYNGNVTSDIILPSKQNIVEPTITGRNLYVIRNARAIANELLQYKADEGNDKWYEEHTIAFPKKKVTLNYSSVALNMQKQDYWFYNGGIASEDNLQNAVNSGAIEVKVDDLGSGITFAKFLNSGAGAGADRAIAFNYPDDDNGKGRGEANAGSCTLKVYGVASDGTRYQIAKFNLIFEDDFEPIIYSEIIGKKDDGTFKSERSPEALLKTTGDPVATITFDPDQFDAFVSPPVGTYTGFTNSGKGDNANQKYSLTYRYPFNYDNTSYCFAPIGGDFNSTDGRTSECTWGNYTVAHRFDMGDNRGNFFAVKKYYENEYGSENYDASQSGFLYIDASDLPGKIASIDFAGMPCKVSRLFVSAWMSSPDRDNESPANVVFSIQGFKNGKATTLYSYCPGSILGQARDSLDKTLKPMDNGGKGIWQQVYFSFVNKNADDFDNFRLTIDNACTNTSGGDILIDDVEVFSVKPDVQIERTIPVCGDQLTLCKMTVDYDQVRAQLGLNTGEVMKDNPKVWYCLLDKEMFDAELGFDTGTPEGQERLYRMSDAEVKPAFVKALLGDPNSQVSGEGIFRSVEFKTNFDSLPVFKYRDAVAATVGMASREVTSAGVRHFVISDKVKEPRIKPNHDYYFLFVPRFSDDPVTLANAFHSFEINTRCSVRCKFRTLSPIRVVTDADDEAAVEHETQTCAGKSVSLSVKQVGEDVDGNIGERIVQYDWWRDYVGGAFTDVCINVDNATWRVLGKNESRLSNEISLREALLAFRHFYPKATTVAGAAPKNDEGYTLEQSVIDVLHQFTLNRADKVASLVLLNNTCNIYVPAATKQGTILKLTVVPIDHEDSSGTQYCYDPEQVGIKVSGEAPQLFDGLHGDKYKYPDKLTNVPVRSSLAAVAEVRARADGSAANVLRVPLRGIETVTKDAIGLTSVSPEVFLAGTNDPTMKAYETKAAEERAGLSVQNFRIVGQLKTLVARNADPENAHADIVFNSDFQPREGYVYTLRFNYRELFNAGNATQSTVCDGNVLVDLIIVPKYQKWTGAAGNTDWTNDANWQRADLADLHFKADTETGYATNADNGTAQGYVPMLHTSVIVTPDKAGPQLYETNNAGANDQFLNFVGNEGKRTATPDIEYALLAAPEADKGVNRCDIYRPYQSKDLVVQSGGELLHAERLDYKKAWVEYALTPDRWYTLGSPLRQSYAGEWYAPNNDACQATPYFKDVKYNTAHYHRFAPAVYQRSWDKANPKLYYLEPYLADKPQEAKVDTTTENIYQAANWSAVYNDVREPYSQGGFSVKVNGIGIGAQKYTKSLFRLPKEDTAYGYYTELNETDRRTYPVDRTYHHKLATDQLKSGTELTVTLRNENANNRFFLVGNPFACALDLNEFFKENETQLNGAKYWVLTAGGQEGAMRQPNAGEWIPVNGTTEAALASLPSGQGFFVEGKEGTNTINLKFTADMQTSLHTSGTLLRAPAIGRAEAPMLRIRASRSGQGSEALVVKDTTAVNGYEAAEDMQLLLDNSLQEIPMVYTLAGNRTSTINRRRSLWRVPLGVLSNSEDPVQLTFSGMRSFGETLSLLDSQTGAVTPLRGNGNADSVKVEVPGVTTGRYFILSSERPALEDEQNFTQPLIQADNGSVTISSSAAHVLTYVRIVAADGRTVYKLTPYVSRLSLKLPTGVYVVEARTDEGESVGKVSL